MDSFAEKYGIKADGGANINNVFNNGEIRITVITPELIRIERKVFCDKPTQTVLHRDLGEVDFNASVTNGFIIVKTEMCKFTVDKYGKLREVVLSDGRIIKKFTRGNLKGTRRTLDVTFGRVKLNDGIMSRDGVALIDDSSSFVLMPDGTLCSRESGGTDVYVFAYGFNYRSALKTFYRITGETPLIPRFCLGNWWSRYWAYTQNEYLDLMDKFDKEKIPITVASVDMDWHWTDVAKRFGDKVNDYPKPKNPIEKITGCFWNPGWTGYSWNKDLFPDHKSFLEELHRRNIHTNLNVHPAQGVRFFEDMYSDFADYMGVDKKNKEPINFDFTDKRFVEGFFNFVNEPMENEGVDFWWIDWQQGNKSAVDGLDPLWLLNHYYCLDRERHGLRPLTLSRYAGLGSHRYPLGFSGDAAVKWSVLDFQPYFTATAANVGYSWWSHDIGGHNFGKRDDELYLRWVQFGVFSPIMRFHSVNDPFMGKEPWKFSGSVHKTAADFLRLRHRMIPYTYTINRLTQTDGRPLLSPMYHEYPTSDEAYKVGNEYLFGTQLIVAPITQPVSKITNMASTEVWLPQGRYTDIFTGRIYKGGKRFAMCRDTTLIPVLAKEGAIIPLDGRKCSNDCDNPDRFEVLVYRGNGEFTLYEDDGETLDYRNGHFAQTKIEVSEHDERLTLKLRPALGDLNVIPQKREWSFEFRDVTDAEEICVDGFDFVAERSNGHICVTLRSVPSDAEVEIRLNKIKALKNPKKKELLIEAVSKIQGGIFLKSAKYKKCLTDGFNGKISAPKSVRCLIEETMNME